MFTFARDLRTTIRMLLGTVVVVIINIVDYFSPPYYIAANDMFCFFFSLYILSYMAIV